MGIWDQLDADGKITFGSNVKEVLAEVGRRCGRLWRCLQHADAAY